MRLSRIVGTLGAMLAAIPVVAATFPDVGMASPPVALVGQEVSFSFRVHYEKKEFGACGIKVQFGDGSFKYDAVQQPTYPSFYSVKHVYAKASSDQPAGGVYTARLLPEAHSGLQACSGNGNSASVTVNAAFTAPIVTAVQAVPGGFVVGEPFSIKSATPEVPSVTTDGQGKATVNFVVNGIGSGQCQLYVSTGEGGLFSAQVSPSAGFPKTIAVSFSKPSTFSIDVYGVGCTGQVKSNYVVQPHPDFPCSLYPGYKKESYGVTMGCHPTAPPASPNPKDFFCAAGTKFQNLGGYVFGCYPPGFFSTQ